MYLNIINLHKTISTYKKQYQLTCHIDNELLNVCVDATLISNQLYRNDIYH